LGSRESVINEEPQKARRQENRVRRVTDGRTYIKAVLDKYMPGADEHFTNTS